MSTATTVKTSALFARLRSMRREGELDDQDHGWFEALDAIEEFVKGMPERYSRRAGGLKGPGKGAR